MNIVSSHSNEYDQLRMRSYLEEQPYDQKVSIEALYRVLHHGERQHGDSHRFASTEDPEDFMSMVCTKIVLLQKQSLQQFEHFSRSV